VEAPLTSTPLDKTLKQIVALLARDAARAWVRDGCDEVTSTAAPERYQNEHTHKIKICSAGGSVYPRRHRSSSARKASTPSTGQQPVRDRAERGIRTMG
jgi:hypothetical protein